MYLKYGTYAHAAGECNLAISRRGDFVHGMEKGYTERWDIRGRLQIADSGTLAGNQAAMTAAIAALQAAYSIQGQDLVFYTDGGTASIHALVSAQSLGGVRIVERPFFPVGRGAEYSTFRNYAIAAEASYVNTALGILDYRETINFSGGGPKFVLLETMTGYPQKQNTRQRTPFRVTQQGEATGLLGYPIAPGPISPGDVHEDQTDIRMIGPDFFGPVGQRAYTGFKTTWTYQMESANPIVGQPSVPIA
jgi:hypothetical protein